MKSMTLAVLITGALIAATTDLRTRHIPNWLTAGMLAYGLIYHAARAGWSGFLLSLGGFTLGLGLLLIPYLLKGLGAGDVKFLAAVGSIVLIQGVIVVFIGASALGAIQAMIALHRKRHVDDRPARLSACHLPAGRHGAPAGNSPVGSPVSIPYGVALSFGTLILTGLLAMYM